MNIRSLLMCGAASSVVAGCAIHPLPEDVTRVSTYQIVQRIRCEARDAVRLELEDQLIGSEYLGSIMVGTQIRDAALEIADFVINYDRGKYDIDPDSRELIKNFRDTSIALVFEFDMRESNTEGSGFGLRDPFFSGLLNIGFSQESDFQRRNIRSVDIAENFVKLLRDTRLATYCDRVDYAEVNGVYPVAGSIGLAEVIHTFLEIATSVSRVGTLADTLEFETRLSGSVSPVLTLTPTGTSLALVGVSGALSAERRDIHRVTVAIAVPKAEPPLPEINVHILSLPSGAVVQGPPSAGAPVAPRTAVPGRTSEERALDAATAEQQKQRFPRLLRQELDDALEEQ